MEPQASAQSSSRDNGPQPHSRNGPVSKSSTPTATKTPGWSHTPGTLTLLWMAISLPLVIWDTGYVLLRPHSMPGGSLHRPLWVPYALYGEVDHMYGFKQWELGNGFTAAQSVMNVAETVLYMAYLGLWYVYGGPAIKGARSAVTGRAGALAVLLGFSAAVMTVSKTLLYWLNEYYSGFDNIGHNLPWALFFLWIVPNGAWIVVPSIAMIYDMGSEIVTGLTRASSVSNAEKNE